MVLPVHAASRPSGPARRNGFVVSNIGRRHPGRWLTAVLLAGAAIAACARPSPTPTPIPTSTNRILLASLSRPGVFCVGHQMNQWLQKDGREAAVPHIEELKAERANIGFTARPSDAHNISKAAETGSVPMPDVCESPPPPPRHPPSLPVRKV